MGKEGRSLKRAVLFVVIALLGGLALGALFGSGMSSAAQAMARGATPAEAICIFYISKMPT